MNYEGKLPNYAFCLWHDAEASSGWESWSEGNAPLCLTAGFITKEDPIYYVFSSTLEGDECNSRITVPKGMIITLSFLPESAIRDLLQLEVSNS